MKLLSHLKRLFRSPFDHEPARLLYLSIVGQARSPLFYEGYGVPDTMDGRFDMVALHTYLMLKRLQQDSPANQELSQALFDIMFADFDQNMREMSIGDTGVAKRIKKMAEGFYGRAEAYDAAMAGDGDQQLIDAIDRNIYRKVVSSPENLANMADYMHRCAQHLDTQSSEALSKGDVSLPSVDAPAAP